MTEEKIRNLLKYFGNFDGYGEYLVLERFQHKGKHFACCVFSSSVGGGFIVVQEPPEENRFRGSKWGSSAILPFPPYAEGEQDIIEKAKDVLLESIKGGNK